MLKLWLVYAANAEAKRMTHAERRGHTMVLHHAASDTMLQQQCLTILAHSLQIQDHIKIAIACPT